MLFSTILHRKFTSAVLLYLAISFGLNGCGDVSTVSNSNTPPIANAGPDLGKVATGTLITLNGSGSSDPNGDSLTYSWTLLSKPAGSTAVLNNPTSASPTFTVDRVGDYTAQLIVSDGKANSTPDTVLVTTNNVAPVANAGPDLGNVGPGAIVTLNGSASFDPNGDPLTYSWSFVSKPAGSAAVLANANSVSPTFTIDRDGDYIVQLIVNDGSVNSPADTATITSNNVPPVGNAGLDQGSKAPGSFITLNGSGSSDANGDPITYSWTFVSK